MKTKSRFALFFLVPLLLIAIPPMSGCGSHQEAPASAAAPPTPAAPPAAAGDSHEMQGAPQTLADWAKGAMLFDGLGDFHRKVSTGSEEAQKYFDQGMRYLWAFNHDESTRSFAKAAQLDPSCASCYWGVALTVGPNYNVPIMAEPRAKVAWEALQQAQKNSAKASPIEQALIAALGKRYNGPQALDPSNEGPVLTAYAAAMKDVAHRFTDDLDVQTLYAESMMNINAWKLWTADGKPAPGTLEIEATLENVLKRDPKHPGANHYYIHTMEASPHPEKALVSAQRLDGMMPMAGHLQHMPAHILQRVGRYQDAADANRKGVEADKAYLSKTHPLDYYDMYVAHNYQFLAYSTAMQGRKAETLDAVHKFREALPPEMLVMVPGVDWYLAEVYTAMDRFGLWDEILAEPAPDAKYPGLTGGYLYAKACAQAAKNRLDDAKATLAQLEKLAHDTAADYGAGLNLARDVFAVAVPTVRGRIAVAENKPDEAITQFNRAVSNEDKLAYDEPADWFVPVRQQLGAVLLKAGKAKEAEAVYREDLKRHPENGWSLYGLAESLKAQKKMSEAVKAERQFREAWKNADVTLSASAY